MHILWISVPPPPLIHVGGFYNNLINLIIINIGWPSHLSPLSTFLFFLEYFFLMIFLGILRKLDGVGPVDNRPSTDLLYHFVQ